MEKKTIVRLLVVLSFFVLAFSGIAFADGDDGVAACNATAVDPNASLEDQQAVCSAAEQFASSSCAAGNHGLCSSPKTNDTMVGANHCICLEPEVAEPVV